VHVLVEKFAARFEIAGALLVVTGGVGAGGTGAGEAGGGVGAMVEPLCS
jgi:hypothetical protein